MKMKFQITDELKVQIGSNIREARKAAGLTQEALAEEMGVNKKHISNLECGKNCPSLAALMEINRICNVSCDQLLYGTRKDSDIPFLVRRACQLPDHQLAIYLRYTDLFFEALAEELS